MDGRPYWGVSHFCSLDKKPVTANRDLTALEWSGNEVFLDETNDVPALVRRGLGIIASWEKQTEREFSQTPLNILLSVGEGDEEVAPSVTLRFWAVRDGVHYIEPSAV